MRNTFFDYCHWQQSFSLVRTWLFVYHESTVTVNAAATLKRCWRREEENQRNNEIKKILKKIITVQLHIMCSESDSTASQGPQYDSLGSAETACNIELGRCWTLWVFLVGTSGVGPPCVCQRPGGGLVLCSSLAQTCMLVPTLRQVLTPRTWRHHHPLELVPSSRTAGIAP